jgi:hypothetical protein
MTFEKGAESEAFDLKLPNLNRKGTHRYPNDLEVEDTTQKALNEEDESENKGRVVRLRTTEVNIDGEIRIIVIIRDLTDSIEAGKI